MTLTDGAEGEVAAVELTSPTGLIARFVPEVGMVGCSLRHHGEEILGLRGGLAQYQAHAKTFGIPLLAPWANRLTGNRPSDTYAVAGRTVTVDPETPGVHLDANGIPIHGLLGAAAGWRVVESVNNPQGGRLVAELAFDSSRPEFPAFPFPHTLMLTIELAGEELRITTRLTAAGAEDVPVAFGWHPYFYLPGAARADWILHHPFRTRLVLSNEQVPTGVTESVEVADGPLADRDFDDLFSQVSEGMTAWVAGGGRRIAMTYGAGYEYAVIYAPADSEVIALEPMTAPTGPFDGHFPVSLVGPGDSFSATFTITVTDADSGLGVALNPEVEL